MNGVCSKLVDSFPDVFVFFSRTCSPGNTGLNTAPCLLSTYALAVSLWFQSRSRTFSSRMFLSLRSSGNSVFSSLPNMRNRNEQKLHEFSFPSLSFHMSHFQCFPKCSVLSLHFPICLWPQRWRCMVFDSMFQ